MVQQVQTPVYLDNHATTRVDPRVLSAMLPYFSEHYGNAGSTSHVFGWDADAAVEHARETIAAAIGASKRNLVFTSGATESNNLALRGATDRARRRGNHIVSVATEHKAVLDPLTRLGRRDFEVTLLAVEPNDGGRGGWLDPQRVRDAIRDDTMLVSVMLANNEIGVLQSLAEIAAEIRGSDILLHTDATQAIGKIAVDVERLGVDLMSFSAHKLYGPKGVGGLFVSRQKQAGRLQPQIDGGGQEGGVRSGTINVPGVVGFARAVELAEEERTVESQRVGGLRDRLFDALRERVADVQLNGPALSAELRLAGNLNCSFPLVDGEALMMSMREICVSSGSACTSANPEPSHVLRALGLSEDMTRASLRFGVGRFNTAAEIDFAADRVGDAVARLRKMSSLS